MAKCASQGIRVVGGVPIPFGISMQEMDFPGTICLMPETLMALMRDVCNSVIKHGFRKIVFVMSHDGNLGALYSIAQEFNKQAGVNVLLVNWIPYMKSITSPTSGGHAGEGEAALVLATFPELVASGSRPDRPQRGWQRAASGVRCARAFRRRYLRARERAEGQDSHWLLWRSKGRDSGGRREDLRPARGLDWQGNQEPLRSLAGGNFVFLLVKPGQPVP